MQEPPQTSALDTTPQRPAILTAISGVLAPLSFLILLSIVLALTAPNFKSTDNLKNIAVQSAVVAILACGQTAVIISGNIDLSVGAVMAFAGISAGTAMAWHGLPMWPAAILCCLAGLGAGTVTGLITAFGKIPSFIVTLGMMGVVYGTAGLIGHSQNIGDQAAGFEAFGVGELFGSATRNGLPYAVLIMAAVAIIVHIALSRTRWGRNIYAMGGNLEAARLSGVNTRKMVVSVFALSGLLAGVAAIVSTSRAGVAEPSAGTGDELYAVAATVIGGTSLFGGQGGIFGTIIGALLMFTIKNGCSLRNVQPPTQRVVIGAIVILAVLYDRFGPGRKRATT